MFRLALALGCTVAELGERITAAELTEWQAFYQLEPWGAWRDNWHHANLASLLYNINRGKNPSIKANAFMYEDAEVSAQKSARSFIAALETRANRHG